LRGPDFASQFIPDVAYGILCLASAFVRTKPQEVGWLNQLNEGQAEAFISTRIYVAKYREYFEIAALTEFGDDASHYVRLRLPRRCHGGNESLTTVCYYFGLLRNKRTVILLDGWLIDPAGLHML
jgi:hypothetical protein